MTSNSPAGAEQDVQQLRELCSEEKCWPVAPRRERMLRLFAYHHLQARPDLQAVSRMFADLAECLVAMVPEGPERTVSLRKLLEAKDAAVRAVAIPEIPG